MPRTRSNLSANQLLHDDECDIMDAYSIVMDGAMDMRRKFSLMVSRARQLESELQEKEASLREKELEIDRLTTLQQKQLSNHNQVAEVTRKKLWRQGRHLQQSRAVNKELRRHNEELVHELEVAQKRLDQVDDLRCYICKDAMHNTVTKCGHVYCSPCLDHWREELSRFTCPYCERGLREGDIWKIYTETDRRTSPMHDESDDATVILISDDDSD